jgi:hypothetical protein
MNRPPDPRLLSTWGFVLTPQTGHPLQGGSREWGMGSGRALSGREWGMAEPHGCNPRPDPLLPIPYSPLGILKFNGSFQDILNQIMAIFWQI